MRRKRKVSYTVSDTGCHSSIYWIHGHGWAEMGSVPNRSGASSMQRYKTLKQAYRAAQKIVVRGGKPLITRWFGKHGVRCTRDMWIPGYVPWT